jgi:hypothetical protein
VYNAEVVPAAYFVFEITQQISIKFGNFCFYLYQFSVTTALHGHKLQFITFLKEGFVIPKIGKGNGKVVPVIFSLTLHHAMKAYCEVEL